MRSHLSAALLAVALPLSQLNAAPLTIHDAGSGKQVVVAEEENQPFFRARYTSSYAFESDFKGSQEGEIAILENRLSAEWLIPLGGKWFTSAGIGYERFDFSGDAPFLAEPLQAVYASTSIEYIINGVPVLFVRALPGVSAAGDLDGGAFDLRILAGAGWRLTPNFAVTAGIRSSLLSKYPVLPVAGFIWNVSDRLQVDAMLPEAGLRYQLTDSIQLSATAGLTGGSFRTGSDDPNFPSTDVDYYDWRAGAELKTDLSDNFTVAFRAGWSIRRGVKFDEPARDFRIDAAPYIGIQARASF